MLPDQWYENRRRWIEDDELLGTITQLTEIGASDRALKIYNERKVSDTSVRVHHAAAVAIRESGLQYAKKRDEFLFVWESAKNSPGYVGSDFDFDFERDYILLRSEKEDVVLLIDEIDRVIRDRGDHTEPRDMLAKAKLLLKAGMIKDASGCLDSLSPTEGDWQLRRNIVWWRFAANMIGRQYQVATDAATSDEAQSEEKPIRQVAYWFSKTMPSVIQPIGRIILRFMV